jgi:hypothetical protein
MYTYRERSTPLLPLLIEVVTTSDLESVAPPPLARGGNYCNGATAATMCHQWSDTR